VHDAPTDTGVPSAHLHLDAPAAPVDHPEVPTTPIEHGAPTDTPPGTPGHDGTPATHLPTDHHYVHETDAPKLRKPFATRTDLAPNTVYDVPDRGIFHTDASGHVTLVETHYGGVGKLNADLQHPVANATYEVSGPHGLHEFHTDSLARVDHVKVDTLVKADAIRSSYTQIKVGKLGGVGFDGGHLVANFLGGGAEKINMVAMLKEINRGGGHSYFNLENDISKAMGSDGTVKVQFEVDPIYGDASKVPVRIEAGYKVGDYDWENVEFINKR
jgi:hypothetical protein